MSSRIRNSFLLPRCIRDILIQSASCAYPEFSIRSTDFQCAPCVYPESLRCRRKSPSENKKRACPASGNRCAYATPMVSLHDMQKGSKHSPALITPGARRSLLLFCPDTSSAAFSAVLHPQKTVSVRPQKSIRHAGTRRAFTAPGSLRARSQGYFSSSQVYCNYSIAPRFCQRKRKNKQLCGKRFLRKKKSHPAPSSKKSIKGISPYSKNAKSGRSRISVSAFIQSLYSLSKQKHSMPEKPCISKDHSSDASAAFFEICSLFAVTFSILLIFIYIFTHFHIFHHRITSVISDSFTLSRN